MADEEIGELEHLSPEAAEPAVESPGLQWKRIAVVVGGVAVTAGAAVAATLAATHRSAVTHNARAFLNGFGAGYESGFEDGFDSGEVVASEGSSWATVEPYDPWDHWDTE